MEVRDRNRRIKGKARIARGKFHKKHHYRVARENDGWMISTTIDNEIVKKMPSSSETFVEKSAIESVKERWRVFLISGR